MITSSQNPVIKEAVALRKKQLRDETGLFIIEGYRELSRALLKGVVLKTLFICPELFLGSNENALIEGVEKARILSCTKVLFEKISYRDRPDGLVAIAYQKKLSLKDLPHKEAALYVIAESIEKPGNLGTILRTADAVAATGVIIVDRCTDLFNPNVVRASVGTCFTVPTVEATQEETLLFLKERQISLVAATPHATLLYTEADLSQSIAIALGTEQYGLSERLLSEAALQVRIPMCGIADSLNVATAASILLYQALTSRLKNMDTM